MTDIRSDADRDACARAAAAAIEAVLNRRCPAMKVAFWSAVEKLYQLDAGPGERRPTAPRPDLGAERPARSR